MRKRLIIIVGFAVCSIQTAHAQHGTPYDEMAFYADAMVNASEPAHRVYAADEFYRLFAEYLNTTEARADHFGRLPWITAVYPADSTFRVITWQIEEEEQFRYHGFVQFLDDPDRIPIEFHDTRTLNSEYAAYNQDTWYGAIYYGIQPFSTTDKENAYLLLGFNAHSKTQNQRVAEVLLFGQNTVTLGLPVFTQENADPKSRVIVEYADAAYATMRFDREKELIIFDHVILVDTPEGPALVPDGSYHGYKYKKGRWLFIDKVFDVIVDEPPGGRESEKVKKDLFGREQKND